MDRRQCFTCGLDISRVKAQYTKVREAIARDDFRQAEVKKLANLGHGKFYRAKLDGADRLAAERLCRSKKFVPAGA